MSDSGPGAAAATAVDQERHWRDLQPLYAALEAADPALITMAEGSGEEAARATPWSGRALLEQADRLAGGLAAAGFAAGDHCILIGGTSARWLTTCLAVLRSGGVVVPIDAQFPDRILTAVIADSGARWIAADGPALERLRELIDEEAVTLLALSDDSDWDQLTAHDPQAVTTRAGDDRAILFYTSGTTGLPKGVPLSHANIAYQLQTVQRLHLLQADDVVLLPLPLHHVYPLVIGLLGPLAAGRPVVLPAAFTGPAVLAAIRVAEVSVVIGVPRLYRALMQGIDGRLAEAPLVLRPLLRGLVASCTWVRRRLRWRLGGVLLGFLRRRIGPRLRLLASGGSPLDPELGWRLEGLGWRVAIGYGLTETAPLLTLTRPGDGRLDTVGEPVPGTELRIATDVLPDRPEPAAAPQTGEVQARGPGVFAGYHDRPEADAEAFTSDGWFRCGDLGYWQDGRLSLAGRLSTMLVTPGGENIQPETIEAAYEEHPVIREIGIFQEGDDLVALVVPDRDLVLRDDRDPEAVVGAALAEHGRQLPSYQRLAAHRLSRSPLPRTRLGKIRRQALQEAYATAGEGDGALRRGPLPITDMAPEDQRLLQHEAARRTWDLLVERFPDRALDPDADLHFDLGLDSMAWLDLGTAVQTRTGVALDEPTIAGLDSVRSLLQAVSQGEAGTAGEPQRSPIDHPDEHLTDDQRPYFAELSPNERPLAHVLHLLAFLVLRWACRLRWLGRHRVPRSGPCLIAPNHVSLVDAPALAAALGRERLDHTWWIGFTEAAFGNPLIRRLSRLGRTIPVDPRGGGASSLAAGSRLLRAGRMLVWFPEGQRSWDGELQPFRPGIGMLIDRLQVPVVPVHIHGAHRVLPRGNSLPRPGGLRIRFGPVLRPEELIRADDSRPAADQVADRLAAAITALGQRSVRP